MRVPWLFLSLIALVPPMLAQANTPRQVAISIIAADEPTSPVQIVSLKRDPTKETTDILLENTAGIAATAVRFQLTTAVPDGCLAEGNGVRFSESNGDVPEPLDRVPGLHLRPVAIRPHERASTVTILPASAFLVLEAQERKTNFLHVQLSLQMVKFADGTMWRSPFRKNVVNTELLKNDEARCREFSQATGFPPLDGVVVVRAESSGEFKALAGERGYMFVCNVRGSKAFCPTK